MNSEQRTRLMYAKGDRYFEDIPVRDATLDDIRSGFCKKLYGENRLSKRTSGISAKQQGFHCNKKRYEGTEAKVGTEMNVMKDVIFEGKILDMVRKSTEFVKGQIKEHTFLGKDGRFITIPELPEFCWTELIVNAVSHRDYSISGTDIQIKMFDDHFTVESPGMLPGLVRPNNIREIHFSRNPKIFEFLHEYEYVKEFGEGVDRMFREMEDARLPERNADAFGAYWAQSF